MLVFKKYLWVALISLCMEWIRASGPGLYWIADLWWFTNSLFSGPSNFQSWGSLTCISGFLRSWGLPALSTRCARSLRARVQCQLILPWLGSDPSPSFSDSAFDIFPCDLWSNLLFSVWVVSCLLWYVLIPEVRGPLLCPVVGAHSLLLHIQILTCCIPPPLDRSSLSWNLIGTLTLAFMVGECTTGVGTSLALSHLNPS